jgi:hypothetical protein
MLKQIAWNIFKNTGDVNAYLEYNELRSIEEKIKLDIVEEKIKVDIDETSKSKWDNNFRK